MGTSVELRIDKDAIEFEESTNQTGQFKLLIAAQLIKNEGSRYMLPLGGCYCREENKYHIRQCLEALVRGEKGRFFIGDGNKDILTCEGVSLRFILKQYGLIRVTGVTSRKNASGRPLPWGHGIKREPLRETHHYMGFDNERKPAAFQRRKESNNNGSELSAGSKGEYINRMLRQFRPKVSLENCLPIPLSPVIVATVMPGDNFPTLKRGQVAEHCRAQELNNPRIILIDENKSKHFSTKDIFPLTNELADLRNHQPRYPPSQPVDHFELDLDQVLSEHTLKKLDQLTRHLAKNRLEMLFSKEDFCVFATNIIDNAHFFVVPCAFIEVFGWQNHKGSYFDDYTGDEGAFIPIVHGFISNTLRELVKKDKKMDLPHPSNIDWEKVIKDKRVYCTRFDDYYARVRVVETVSNPTGQLSKLIVLDVDYGTIVPVQPHSLLYLPRSLSELTPLGILLRPSQLGRSSTVSVFDAQEHLGKLLERSHPRLKVQVRSRQPKKSDTLRGPFYEGVIELRESNQKYLDLAVVASKTFPHSFKVETDPTRIAQMSRLQTNPASEDIISREVQQTRPFEVLQSKEPEITPNKHIIGTCLVEHALWEITVDNRIEKLNQEIKHLSSKFRPMSIALKQCGNGFYYEDESSCAPPSFAWPTDLPLKILTHPLSMDALLREMCVFWASSRYYWEKGKLKKDEDRNNRNLESENFNIMMSSLIEDSFDVESPLTPRREHDSSKRGKLCVLKEKSLWSRAVRLEYAEGYYYLYDRGYAVRHERPVHREMHYQLMRIECPALRLTLTGNAAETGHVYCENAAASLSGPICLYKNPFNNVAIVLETPTDLYKILATVEQKGKKKPRQLLCSVIKSKDGSTYYCDEMTRHNHF